MAKDFNDGGDPITGCFSFIGIFDELPETAKNGDIVVLSGKDNKTYVHSNGEWYFVPEYDEDADIKTKEDKPKIYVLYKCKSCGANLVDVDTDADNITCPYCRTAYHKRDLKTVMAEMDCLKEINK